MVVFNLLHMKGGSFTPHYKISKAHLHSCADGLGAALLEHSGVNFVVKGHLHGKHSGRRNHESFLPFEQIFPCWFSAGNLMVERSAHALRQLHFCSAIWTMYDLNDTSLPN